MRKTLILAGALILSAPAFAAQPGPANGYMTSLRDQYKPVTVTIVIDRSTSKPTVIYYHVAIGCGGCGGRGETHTGSTAASGGTGGGVHNTTHVPSPGTGGITGHDILDAIAAGFGGPSDMIGTMGGSVSGAVGTPDGGRSADPTTGGTGLSGGDRNANGDSLGIGN